MGQPAPTALLSALALHELFGPQFYETDSYAGSRWCDVTLKLRGLGVVVNVPEGLTKHK